MKTYDQMTALFESADTYFREQDKALFWSQVSERTLCGALIPSKEKRKEQER